MRLLATFVVSMATILMVPFISYASPISPSLTLSTGGLNFDNFTCAVTGEGYALPTTCGSIDVQTIKYPTNGIQVTSGFTAASFSSSLPCASLKSACAFSDAQVNYHVSSASGLDMVGLSYNGSFDGYAISSVTETVRNPAGAEVGFARVSCDEGFLGGCQHTDNIYLSGTYHDLYIEKDINVSSFIGEAQISYIDQTFALAPEPSSITLLGGGLLGFSALLRRRAKLNLVKAETES